MSRETTVGVNSRFAVGTEAEVLQMLTFLGCVLLPPRLYMIIHLFEVILDDTYLHLFHLNFIQFLCIVFKGTKKSLCCCCYCSL